MKDITIKLNIPQLDFFREKQSEPTLHVYFLNCGAESAQQAKLDWNHFNEPIQVPVTWKQTKKICPDAAMAFDLYVRTANCEGIWCRMHRASATLFMNDFKDVEDGNRCVYLPLENRWTGETVGKVGVCFGDLLKGVEFDEAEGVDVRSNEFGNHMEKLIRQEMGLFEGFWALRSKNGFIKRVHAPIFNGRVASMPGFSYLMNATSFRGDEMWYLHWYKNACKRLNVDDATIVRVVETQFAIITDSVSSEFHVITLIMATMVASSVTCYPYETDFYVEHGAQKPYESFDNVFVRKAGDCEDFGRGMHFVFSTFCALKISRAHAGMRALQRVCRLYLSGVVLGTVSQNSHGASVFKTRQAHMYVKLFPVMYFTNSIRAVAHHGLENARFPAVKDVLPKFAPWMERLRVYTVEGTAPVQPFTSVQTMQVDRNEARAVFERKSVSLQVPCGMVREYRPIWGVFEDPFYKTDCHVYTDYYIERGFPMGSFAFFDTKTNKYGVPMQRVLDQEGVAIVPHQVFTEKDIQEIRRALRFEHPMPKMTMSYRSGKEWSRDNPKVQEMVEKFVATLQARAKNRNKNDKENRSKGELYNDFFIQSPQQLTQDQLNDILEFLKKHADGFDVAVEGLEPEEMIIRVRSYDGKV